MMRLDLQRIGAVCAVLYAGLIILATGLMLGVGFASAKHASDFLPLLAAHQGVAMTVSVLFVVMPLLVAVAGMGFFLMLHRDEPLAWLALFGFVGGGLSILYRGFIWVAMTLELAPAYVHADARNKVSLGAVGNTLQVFSSGADLVGAVLVAGIGGLIFSVLMYRERVGPPLLAWLGIAAAFVGGWLTLLTKTSELVAAISWIGDLGFFLWIAMVGVITWRGQAPIEPPSSQPLDHAEDGSSARAAIAQDR